MRHNASSEKSGGTNNDRRRGSSAGNTSASKEDLIDKNRFNNLSPLPQTHYDKMNPIMASHQKGIILERLSEENDSNLQGSINTNNNPLEDFDDEKVKKLNFKILNLRKWKP